MLRSILCVLAFCGPAAAQEWTSNTFDTGALLHGAAIAPGGTFVLSCTAPSPQGRPLIETGDHESLRTDEPYGLAISFTVDLIDPSATEDLNLPSPQMILDGQAYPLPAMQYSDFYGVWSGLTNLETPGILELFQATTLVVDPGRGTAFEYPVLGLNPSLDVAFAPCVERWFDLGNPLTPRLEAYVTTGVAPDQPAATPIPLDNPPALDLPDGLTAAPRFEIPDVAPQAAFDHIYSACEGPFDITDFSAITASDFDGDGVADYILNYTSVICNGGLTGRAFCGAANCSIDVFLSSQEYRSPAEFLGLGLDPVQDAQGRIGVLLSGTFSLCADGFCDTPFYWNGTEFAQ